MESKQSHVGQQQQKHVDRKRRSTGSGETDEELALKLLPGIVNTEKNLQVTPKALSDCRLFIYIIQVIEI